MIGNRLQAIGYSIVIFLFAFLLLPNACCLTPVYATDSTPSATIQSKLDALKKEIASKAATLKQEVNQKLQNKAYVGAIKSASGSSILVIDKNGVKNIKVNQDTVYENRLSKKKVLKFTDLKEGQLVAALGEMDELKNLIAKKIILLADSDWQEDFKTKTILWGKVVSSDDEILTVRDRDGKNNAVSTKDIDTTIKTNEFAIFTGYLNKNSIITAAFGYIIPQGGILRPKRLATPSATESTSSTRPKPTPTVKPKTATPSAKKK